MDFKKWFKSKPKWIQYATIGAIAYPAIIIILMILSFITSPIKLNFIFETLEGIIIFPAYVLTNYFINKLFIMENYDSFRFHYLGLSLFFTIIIGFLIGLVAGKIKSNS